MNHVALIRRSGRAGILAGWLVLFLCACGGSTGSVASMGGAGGTGGVDGTGGVGGTVDAGGGAGAGFDAVPSGDATGDGGPADGGISAPDAGADVPAVEFQRLIWRHEPGPGFALRAIGGTGPTDVWVVGEYRQVWNSKGDGIWQHRDPGTTDRMDGVWGTGPDDVYLAPNVNYILHWKGSWVKETLGIPTSVTFHEFWGTGPNNIYVAGGGLFHSNGNGRWSPVDIPSGTNGIAHLGGSGNDVWGVGLSPVVIHTTGDGKFTSEIPGLPSQANDLWVAGPSEVYVVSAREIRHRRSDGKWVAEDPGPFVADLEAIRCVWGSSPTDVYAGTSRGRLLRSRGDGRWVSEFVDPATPGVWVDMIWGTSEQNVYLLTSGGVLHGRP